jgi:hypothetical protein
MPRHHHEASRITRIDWPERNQVNIKREIKLRKLHEG